MILLIQSACLIFKIAQMFVKSIVGNFSLL